MIIGNAVADAVLRATQDGTNVCSFTVAVNRKGKNKEKDTDYFKVSAWRGLAENCAKYVKKGMKVCVVGSVSVSTYNAQNGETRASMDVTANEVEFLTRVQDDSSSTPHEDYSQAPEVQRQPQSYADVSAEIGDELPF